MEEIFVTQLRINKVRHLENLVIPLSETERKHLILTGKNGSGKTSVLEGIRGRFNSMPSVQDKWGKKYFDDLKKSTIQKINDAITFRNGIDAVIKRNKNLEEIDEGHFKVDIFFSKEENNPILHKWRNNEFILQFFSARREPQYKLGIDTSRVDDGSILGIEEKVGHIFIQFLINLKNDELAFSKENENKEAQKIHNWFVKFENLLQIAYNDPKLRLHFYQEGNLKDFYIIQEGHLPFSFNQFSDGYASLIEIVAELLVQMQQKKNYRSVYDLQGIVLIDEIETHLHIDLQKKILPFLTSFFPKIQFIVTTHSPFVLSSIDNAVIYDLEKQQIGISDLSGYSADGIIEGYFEQDKYSEKLKGQVSEYEILMGKDVLNDDESDKLYFLEKYFEELPKFLAPELQVKIQQIKLAKLA